MDTGLDKRERILAAAARLIVENGLQSPMSAIADEAGVAIGSIYNYFRSKEDLVRGVYGRVAEEMTARLAVPHDPATSHEARVRHYIAAYIDFIWEDPLRARLFDYLDNSPLTSGEAAAIFGPFVDHAVGMLDDARGARVVRDGPLSLMASFVRGAIRNTLKRRRTNPNPLEDGERTLLADMCWAAIAAEGSHA